MSAEGLLARAENRRSRAFRYRFSTELSQFHSMDGRITMKKVYHVVLLKFPQAKTRRADELFAALREFCPKLPGFLAFTGGPYTSPEGLNQGYTHGFVMTFTDATAR